MKESRGLGTRVGELHVGRRTGSKAQRQSSTLEKINMVQNDRSREQGQVSKYRKWGVGSEIQAWRNEQGQVICGSLS